MCDTVVWHGDHEPVVSNGVTVTVAWVLPERRWAIRSDGRLKDVAEVNQLHETKYIETFAIADQPQSGDPGAIPKPHPLEFVKWTVDPANKEKRIRIGFDPYKPAPENIQRRTAEDAARDPVAAAQGHLVPRPQGVSDGYRHPDQLEDSGVLGGQMDPQAKVALADRMHEAGALSDAEHKGVLRKTAEEAGWATSDSRGVPGSVSPDASAGPDSASSALFSATSQCGRKFEKGSLKRAQQAVRMHERRCRECVAVEPPSEG
jgi:hypothetical protein